MIRQYTNSDTEALVALWARANALAHPFLSKGFVAQVAKDMRDIYLPNAETWVLEEENRPIGFIALIGTEIGGLFVEPASIGKGFGKMLVDHAVALKGPLHVEVFKDNAVGRPFYERYGFVFQEEYFHDPSGAIAVKMAMPSS